jgi:hypothetical protein
VKFAVVAGGWHWPILFYERMAQAAEGAADLYVVAHRNPELPIVQAEKTRSLAHRNGRLGGLDRHLYHAPVTVDALRQHGWVYFEAPNIAGDQVFLNQWLRLHGYRDWDGILNCHDDTYLLDVTLFDELDVLLDQGALLVTNGRSPEGVAGYFRGSFEFWSRDLLGLLGGHVDVGPLRLTRVGREDSPVGREALADWNRIGHATWEFLAGEGLMDRVVSLSPRYRISRFAIEGERGFVSNRGFGAHRESYDRGVAEILS